MEYLRLGHLQTTEMYCLQFWIPIPVDLVSSEGPFLLDGTWMCPNLIQELMNHLLTT